MTSAEKILAGILDAARAAAAETAQKAEDEAQRIAENAALEVEGIRRDAAESAEKQVQMIAATGESGAALILRDAALACKRELIDETLRLAADEIRALPDGEYFDFLAAVAANSGLTSGEMMLSRADLARDVSRFRERLSGTGITLAEQPAEIDGGFILKQGDIEINAAPEALIHEKYGELVDEVNRLLFG